MREADDYRDLRDRLEEYAAQQEAHELERPRRGGGETRTHYRGVLSFGTQFFDVAAGAIPPLAMWAR